MADAVQQTRAAAKEGSRWRHARPSEEEVKDWFGAQPLDEGMKHEDFLSGIVLIPASEKVKTPRADGKGIEERYENTFTPYVRVDMRVLYFTRLAELRELVRVIEPAQVSRIEDPQSAYFNANMSAGLWWHLTRSSDGNTARFLASTWQVSLYDRRAWMARESDDAPRPPAILQGIGTKQTSGGADANAIMKAETGAIGRALGAAGILVVGTGVATAEDMQESIEGSGPLGIAPETALAPAQTAAADPAAQLQQLRGHATGLEAEMRQYESTWADFTAWWQQRSTAEGWKEIADVPADALRGIIGKMERAIDKAKRAPQVEAPPPQVEQG